MTREKPACWTPHPGDDCWASGRDPLLIMAMDHRESFGRALFGFRHDDPDAAQRAAVTAAKRLIHAGLARARAELPRGRARFPRLLKAAGQQVMPSAVSKRACWSWRGRSPLQTRAATAVSGHPSRRTAVMW